MRLRSSVHRSHSELAILRLGRVG